MNRRTRRARAAIARRVKHPQMDFICPFCLEACHADAATMTVAHAEPTCEMFRSTNPLEFMQAVQEKVTRVASEAEG